MAVTDYAGATALIGRRVVDPEHVVIGSCSAVFADDDSGVPQWLAVALPDTDRVVVVPLEGAAEERDEVTVAVGQQAAASAPVPGSTDRLSRADQQLLSGHYARPDTTRASSASVRMRVAGAGAERGDLGWAASRDLRPPMRVSRSRPLRLLACLAAAVGLAMALRRRLARRHVSSRWKRSGRRARQSQAMRVGRRARRAVARAHR
jgi:hypothetical protein